jgi:hypothetical protein
VLPFSFNKITIQRFGPLTQYNQTITGAKIRAREPVAHIVASELCYGHAENLGRKFHGRVDVVAIPI